MTDVAAAPSAARERSRAVVVSALGVTQILAWGSSYYLPAVLAGPIVADTGWPLGWVIGGVSIGLFVSGGVAPAIGRAIERRGGRPVLIASAVLLAGGLAALAAAPNLAMYLAAWVVIGLGMGAGLYDAAFATLGRRYGTGARGPITALTLWGGFASTVCWPLSAVLVAALGWRGTCLAYAALHLGVVLPLYLLAMPREAVRAPARASGDAQASAPAEAGATQNGPLLFALLALALTLGSVISSVISVHLLTLLQARDVALGAAVALGALVGPSQVGARIVEMAAGRRLHPIWTMVASSVLVAAGLAILWAGLPVIAVALVLYGAGVGIKSIARGTLPLALYGAAGYAALMGRLAMPSLIAQSLSPTLGAVLLDWGGADGTLAVLTVMALANIAAVAALFPWCRKPTRA